MADQPVNASPPPAAVSAWLARAPVWAWLVGVLVTLASLAVVVTLLAYERTLHGVLDGELRDRAERAAALLNGALVDELQQAEELAHQVATGAPRRSRPGERVDVAVFDDRAPPPAAQGAPALQLAARLGAARTRVVHAIDGQLWLAAAATGAGHTVVVARALSGELLAGLAESQGMQFGIAQDGVLLVRTGAAPAGTPLLGDRIVAAWHAMQPSDHWRGTDDHVHGWVQPGPTGDGITLIAMPIQPSFMPALEGARRAVVAIVALLLILIGLLGLLLAQMLATPVQRLADRADVLARRYAVDTPTTAPRNEIARLAASFRHMTGALVSYSDRLEQAHRIATERNEALARAHARAELLHALALAANESATARAALERALHELAAFLRWPLGHIVLLPASIDGHAESVWHDTAPERFAPFVAASEGLAWQHASGPFAGRALMTGTPHWIADLARLDGWRRAPAARAAGLVSGFVVPVVAQGEVLALIEFFADTRQPPNAEALDTLDAVAAELSRLAERRRAERTLQSSEADLRVMAAVAASTNSLVAVTDPAGRVSWINDGFARASGYEAEEILGRAIDDFVGGSDTSPAVRAAIEAARAAGRSVFGLEACNRRKDGARYWTQLEVQPVTSRDGALSHWIWLQTDITQRKDAEAALADSAAYFRALFDDSPLAAMIQDAERRLARINNAYVALVGHPADELLGRDPFSLVHPEDRAATEAFRAQVFAQPGVTHHFERRLVRGDGSTVWVRGHTAHHTPIGRPAYTISVLEDITALHEQQELLREAKDMAEAANRAKSQFLANMSHEIRTPMNGVLGMTELLLGTQLTDRQRRFAEAAYRSGETLLEIINDILDFSKIEAGKLELERAEFNLRTLVEDLIDLHAPHAYDKRIELAARIDTRLPTLLVGDPMRLRQVLTNLLSNAIKFTPSGEVEVSVLPVASAAAPGADGALAVRFEVRDTGIGIAPDALPRLFTAFMQADQSMSRRFGGTGLGLAITRQLVELMGGRIEAESEPGRGSRFWFELPLAAGSGAAHVRGSHLDLAGRRVLVVEDNPTNRAVLEGHLSAYGIVVTPAEHGRQALELARAAAQAGQFFDAALVDMHMPVMNGIALVEALRADAALARLPVIMLSSLAVGDEALLAQRQVDVSLLSKPVRQQELVNALADVLVVAQPSATAAPEAAPADTAALAARVLLVEDNPVNQELARAMLAGLGCDVTIAGNGREALEELTRARFDLVMMDCQMPEMDGFEAVRRLRDPAYAEYRFRTPRDVPVIAITANALAGDAERCLAAGFTDYLAKPFKRQDLAGLVQRWSAVSRAGAAPQTAAPAAAAPAATATSAPPAADEVAQLDPATLERIRDMEARGASRLLERLVRAYLDWADRLMGDAQRALDGREPEALRHAVHTLKSASANLGALEFSRLCAELETMAREGRLEEARAPFAAAQREHVRVLRALGSIVGGGAGNGHA